MSSHRARWRIALVAITTALLVIGSLFAPRAEGARADTGYQAIVLAVCRCGSDNIWARYQTMNAGIVEATGAWVLVSSTLVPPLQPWPIDLPGPGTYRVQFRTVISTSEDYGVSSDVVVDNASPTVTVPTTILVPRGAGVDWDGDHYRDLMGIDVAGRLTNYSRPSGVWMPRSIGTGWGSFTAVIASSDWDGDGFPDLLARDRAGGLYLYQGDGRGGWVSGLGQRVGSGWNSITTFFAGQDFDRDGAEDLLAVDKAGRLLLYDADRHGGWAGVRVIGSGWGGFTSVLAAGDVDGDYWPDIVARTPDGRMLLYRGDGTGGWAQNGAPTVIGTGWNVFTAVYSVGNYTGGSHDFLGQDAAGQLWQYSLTSYGWSNQHLLVGTGWSSMKVVR